MGAAKPKSWRRELARAGLLAAILLGLPLAAGAAARYRHHIRACYWAWRWARADGQPFKLKAKLSSTGAPRSAGALAARLAYDQAESELKRVAAADLLAECGGLHPLYALVRSESSQPAGSELPTARKAFVQGAGSPAEIVLMSGLVGWVSAELVPPGARNVSYNNLDPNHTPRAPYTSENLHHRRVVMQWDWGSYRATYSRDWSYDPDIKTGPRWKLYSPDEVIVKRLPGPWRQPPPPEQADDQACRGGF